MDKLIKIIILIIIFSSCGRKEKFDSNQFKIFFRYEKFITIDFKTKLITVVYVDLKYIDTINLSETDSLFLQNSFIENKISKISGEYVYPDCPWLMPSFEDRIQIYKNERIRASFGINYKPNCPFEKPSFSSQEYRVRTFGEDIRKVILENNDFQRALDTLYEFQKRKKGLFL
jgi:hypothetical protein